MDVKTLYNGKHSVLFPVAAVSNYFKLTEFEQHKFIQSSGDQKSAVGLTGPK